VEVANSTLAGNTPESITYSAETAGTYYIKVRYIDWEGHKNNGIYTLKIEMHTP